MSKTGKRSSRLTSVIKLAENREKRAALEVARTRKQLRYYEEKLTELRSYHEEYRRTITQEKLSGISTSQLKEYQYFMKQLDEGISQLSRKVLEQERFNRNDETLWMKARQRTDVLDKLVDKLKIIEKKFQDNRSAKEQDDTAQNAKIQF